MVASRSGLAYCGPCEAPGRHRVMGCRAAAFGGCATFAKRQKLVLPQSESCGFVLRQATPGGRPRLHAVYVPHAYDPSRKWPLVAYLHGRGERGDCGLLPTDNGLAHAIRRNPERFPCIAVFPQCPDGVMWDKAIEVIEAACEDAAATYNIDERCVYLTGISMGGYASWVYGARRADRFAALLPIAGGGNIDDAPVLASLPIWAFHGAADAVVPVEESRKMVEAVRAAGGSVRYAELPETGHNSWDAAYGHAKVVRWLFRQRRR